MGLLDSFEKGLERAVNSAFAKTFRSGIQPVEIASALRREIDTKAAVVSRDRIIVPTRSSCISAVDDATAMHSLGPALIDELHSLVTEHARSQGYSFSGPVSIALEADERRPPEPCASSPHRESAASPGRPSSSIGRHAATRCPRRAP